LKIETILSKRDLTHGSFQEVAKTAQALKSIIHHALPMAPHHLEALDLIATKIARICHGDPYETDHWIDIQGYAMLASLKDEND
jgi:hypothetical protein|tara:strand:- start:506 stop:757 length:252 start_codon:yes stop_codon:yes gene_type:complete